jgi:hypothetical protein
MMDKDVFCANLHTEGAKNQLQTHERQVIREKLKYFVSLVFYLCRQKLRDYGKPVKTFRDTKRAG